MKTAIILGATGLTGGHVLNQLLDHPNYDKIKIFTRKATGVSHPKVEEYLVDLLNLSAVKSDFTGDEVYVCIGTTKKKTADLERYKDIDYGIPVAAAKLCKENNIPVIAVVSAIGADPESSMFYSRFKGEMERDVKAQRVERTYILRPSFIGGDRQETRIGERIGLFIFKLINPLMIGGLKKYAIVDSSKIAAKMIALANTNQSSVTIESDKI